MLVKVFPVWPKRVRPADTQVRIKVGDSLHTFTEPELREMVADATHALRIIHGHAQPEEVEFEQAHEA